MKRLLILVAVLITAALPTFAQSQADIITLNDATPAIDVAISLPANATGTIDHQVKVHKAAHLVD